MMVMVCDQLRFGMVRRQFKGLIVWMTSQLEQELQPLPLQCLHRTRMGVCMCWLQYASQKKGDFVTYEWSFKLTKCLLLASLPHKERGIFWILIITLHTLCEAVFLFLPEGLIDEDATGRDSHEVQKKSGSVCTAPSEHESSQKRPLCNNYLILNGTNCEMLNGYEDIGSIQPESWSYTSQTEWTLARKVEIIDWRRDANY